MHGFGPLTADAAPRPATVTQAGPRDGGGIGSNRGGGSNTGEEYAWERSYERSWEAVTEDAEGRLVAETSRRTYATGRTDASLAAVQRGMLRHVFVILDASRGMEVNDLKPSRAAVAASILKEFIGRWVHGWAPLCHHPRPAAPYPAAATAAEFFDQNPISKLGLITTQQGAATKLSELGTNPRRHVERLDAAAAATGRSASAAAGGGIVRGGDMSLQTALEMALRTLELIPPYGTREVRACACVHARGSQL